MSAKTDLLKLAAELDFLLRVAAPSKEGKETAAKHAKNAVEALHTAQQEWKLVVRGFEGPDFVYEEGSSEDVHTVQRYLSDALDGAKNTMYGLQED